MSEVRYSISDHELSGMSGSIPIAVQMRMKLNDAGFKFADDNKLASVINKNPMPLGVLTQDYDVATRTTRYKQVI